MRMAIVAPDVLMWLLIAAAVVVAALVAEDVAGYLRGRNALTGRIVYAVQRLWKRRRRGGAI